MNATSLTSAKAKASMPTECADIAAAKSLVLGAIRISTKGTDALPSGWELDQEAKARFGSAKIANCDPREDDNAMTWLVVRA